MFYEQADFDIRCEWGREGIAKLSTISDVAIVVDVMSFSTCVDIAVSNGTLVFPYRWKDETAIQYAKSKNAKLANSNRQASVGFSLSPASLSDLTANTKIVLPSPNGSTLSLLSKSKHTLAGLSEKLPSCRRICSEHRQDCCCNSCGRKDGTMEHFALRLKI